MYKMHPGGMYGDGVTETQTPTIDTSSPTRNPLICYICKDYFTEPCLLTCYHTFCARCLQSKASDNKLSCPICGTTTALKDGCTLPPPDNLMRHLIDLANTDNPPCSNCDKRDRPSMFFCSTCGQALCTHCRENTHRAKMFSTHEIVHMSKCSKDGHRRCAIHGEQYIMFSNSQRNMLCVNCFRDTPADGRLHCVDIDTAYTQGCKNLERAILGVREIQGLVRSGIVACRTLLDGLHHNTNTEKTTIHSFCQGMQDAISKTQSNMLLEVQRQYETKERVLHSQLVGLSSVLPILQTHLVLCQCFSSAATKFQFLDLAYPMIDRLTMVSQMNQPLRPLQTSQIRTNYKSEFAQSLEPWIGKPVPPPPPSQGGQGQGQFDHGQESSVPKKHHHTTKLKALDDGQFTNHCRTFESQMKELGAEVSAVRERLTHLQRDVAVLKRAAIQPLAKRHTNIARDCERLDSTLQQYHGELDRLRATFETLWQDQLRRIRLEQDIFQSQIGEVVRVRCEVKQLAAIAQELEPCVKRLSQSTIENMASLNVLIDQISNMNTGDQAIFLEQVQKSGLDKGPQIKDIGPGDHYGRSSSDHRIKGVISHIIDKVRTKEDRKKSPVQEDIRSSMSSREGKPVRDPSCERKSAKQEVTVPKGCSMYHAHSTKSLQQVSMQGCSDETITISKKGSKDNLDESVKPKMRSKLRSKEYQDEDSDYQRISEATTVHTRAHVHKSATPPAVYPHSDTEDSVFYPDTPTSGRRSSTDVMDRRKTLVVVIGHGKGKGKGRLMQKQRSWETFPPKRRNHHQSSGKFCRDPDSFRGAFEMNGLKKADSFEGHEEAVRTLVAAVQETRTLRKSKPASLPDAHSA